MSREKWKRLHKNNFCLIVLIVYIDHINADIKNSELPCTVNVIFKWKTNKPPPKKKKINYKKAPFFIV